MPTDQPSPTDQPGASARTGSSAGAPARGADLARQILAQAKRDSRERARGGQGGGRSRSAGSAANGRGWSGAGAGEDGAGLAGPDSVGGAAGRRLGGGEDDEPPRPVQLPGIARPGRVWREPVAFGPALGRLLAARGWKPRAADASVLSRWDVIVGPDIADHCTPVSLREGHLELVAESTAWATQLRMLSRQILAILHRELGPEVVRQITIRGPSTPNWQHGRIRTGGRGPRDTYG